MVPPVPAAALKMEELEKWHSPQSQEMCKERGANSSAGEETLVEISKDTGPRPMAEQDNNEWNLASKNANLASLNEEVVNLSLIVESNEASNASRFTNIETRVTKLEDQQSGTDVSKKSSRDQVTLADLAKRLEVLETFVYSMPMDLTKTIGKPKCIPPPSGFDLERRIAALERVISMNTAEEGPTIGFERSLLKPVPWTNISANNDAGTSRSLSPFEQVPRIAEDALDKPSSKYLTLPAPPGEIDPFQHPSPAYPPSEGPQDSDAVSSMGLEELVGPEFAWLPELSERPAVSSAHSEDGSAGNGSFFDIEKDRLK
ncbi:hypothetical protein FRC00_004176 [Tulasnella sp. 408]|nr:hypothetical protein FRC00_004176 [Tulasnella sp. 408]